MVGFGRVLHGFVPTCSLILFVTTLLRGFLFIKFTFVFLLSVAGLAPLASCCSSGLISYPCLYD